jgi:HlyD family secretion protein
MTTRALYITVVFVGVSVLTLPFLSEPVRAGSFLSPKPAAPKVATPPPANLAGIGAIGYIEPRSRILRLSHDAGPEGARIKTLNVKVGDTVKAGDVIALFSDYDRKVARRHAVAKDIPTLQARIKAEQANLDFRTRDYERILQAQSSAISISAKEEAASAVKQSKALIQSMQAEIDATKADLELAEEEIKQSQVTSPIDGTITAVHARPGERVGEQGIVELADLSRLDVVAEVYERDISRVTVGQSAEIRVPGSDTPITGTVYEIGYVIRKNDLDSTDPLKERDRRVIEVRIELDGAASAALRHMLRVQVDVRIL